LNRTEATPLLLARADLVEEPYALKVTVQPGFTRLAVRVTYVFAVTVGDETVRLIFVPGG